MKNNFLISALIVLALFTSGLINVAHAGLIKVEDWHLTTDSNAGLRQSTHTGQEDLYFAVSQSNVWDFNSTYEAIAGYKFATTADMQNLFSSTCGSDSTYKYYNQGGWSQYTWEGKSRHAFAASDTQRTGFYGHAGNFQCTYNVTSFSQGQIGFAGFLMLVDHDYVEPSNGTSIPEPTTLAMFAIAMIGLVSRRIKS